MVETGQISFGGGARSPVLAASGDVVGGVARNLSAGLAQLDPATCPSVTLDLRGATSVDPPVAVALMRAWDRRARRPGSVRVLVSPGAVARFLDMLGLGQVVETAGPRPSRAGKVPAAERERWEQARRGSVARYHALLEAAHERDLASLQRAAREAHPICVASGAEPGGSAFGEWCEQCPMAGQYGGCHPIIDQMLRAAGQANWEAAELLILSLIAEAAGMRLPA
jgi:hypothetical protein